jgi:sporulation integral membrane protein YtvI
MDHKEEKLRNDKQTILSIIKYALIAALLVGVVLLGVKILWLLLPVLIGFVIAHTSAMISAFLYRLVRRKRPRSVEEGGDSKGYRALKLIVFFLILLTFIGVIILVIIALIAQVRNLVTFIENNLPSTDYIQGISAYLQSLSDRLGGILPQSAITKLTDSLTKLQDDLYDLIPKFTSAALSTLLSFVGNFPDIMFKVIVVIMAGYYYISDKIVIGKFMHTLFPSPTFVQKVVGAVTKVSSSFFRVLGGYVIIMTVTFFEALIGLTIIRMPYAVIFAIAVMFIDLLPMVGASACFIPISIYMFVQGQPLYGVIALSMVGIMTFVRSIMEPKIIGTAIRLHPLATLVSMLLGVAAFGLIGFLAGPILVVFTLGLADAFGFHETFRAWSGKFLNKVAHSGTVGSPNPPTPPTVVSSFSDSPSPDPTAPAGTTAVAETTGPVAPPIPSPRRIRHIVMWQLLDTAHGMSREEVIRTMAHKLNSLPPLIPQILSFDVGTDIRYDATAYDLVLVSEFASREDLDLYKKHPEHVKVANWIHQAVKARSVVDFEV